MGPVRRHLSVPETRVCCPPRPADSPSLVFDQGEPGRTKDPAFVTGDGFSIDLTGGPYTLYTRAGYIERRQHPGGQLAHLWFSGGVAWLRIRLRRRALPKRQSSENCALACAEKSVRPRWHSETASVISVTAASGHGIYRRAGVGPDDLLPV